MKNILASLLLTFFATAAFAGDPAAVTASATAAATPPKVQLHTSLGDITIELNPSAAPKTTANFLRYVDEGFYNNTLFHRVMPRFMIQGGGFQPGMVEKPTHSPIVNESDNGLKNLRGTIAMARTQQPHSATAQFFINHIDNAFLDGSAMKPGYAVFGKVVSGIETVDKIAQVATVTKGPHGNVPVQDVVILSAQRLP